MTFQNIRMGRVMLAVFIIFALNVGVSLAVSTVYVMVRVADVMDPNASPQEQEDALQQEIDALMEEIQSGSEAITRLTIVQWSLATLITLVVTYLVVRQAATDAAQAVGYGALIGLGVLLVYGLCICGAVANGGVKLAFLVLVGLAALVGGQWAGRKLKPQPTASQDVMAVPGLLNRPAGAGHAAETYYNMGVQAALGGRREEARQHFTRAVQQNPRYVEAWLQLANLSETAEQAWKYVQQARALAPNDPSVQRAVAIIWPQVSASATRRASPGSGADAEGDAHTAAPPAKEPPAAEASDDEPPASSTL